MPSQAALKLTASFLYTLKPSILLPTQAVYTKRCCVLFFVKIQSNLFPIKLNVCYLIQYDHI